MPWLSGRPATFPGGSHDRRPASGDLPASGSAPVGASIDGHGIDPLASSASIAQRGRVSAADPYNSRMAGHQEHESDHGHGVAVEATRPELARPPLYSVLLLNDDYTPMDFVVEVLTRFFSMPLEKATQVMLHVHTRGRGVCGVFTREIAESKVAQVNEFARMNQHPLLCTMEKA